MATILLSAAGAAIGAGFGGTVLGLSGAVIGRAVGATLGRAIDQRLLGRGSGPVEVGRVERFRVTGAGEGLPVAQVWGRVRVGGQVIWASRFAETRTETRRGKGGGGRRTVEFSYSVSLAIALCEGEIARVGRIWADGQEIAPDTLDLRVYTGSEDQLPDPKIEAVEGSGQAPAYRGIAYVVIEDLALARFGNRVPQFSFEVIRAAQGPAAQAVGGLQDAVRAVALIPGTGEYALATSRVHHAEAPGLNRSVNVNTPSGRTDFETALEQLTGEAPRCRAVSLIVSWFGDDLRCGACRVRPKVEQTGTEGEGQPWRAGGIGRDAALAVAQLGGRPVYGGTPSDASVIEAIAALRDAGQAVMFYPFVLMEQLAGNGLPDPWGGAEQAVLPWRGRITLSVAPGRASSPDRSAAAEAEVAAFFGAVGPEDFAVTGGQVVYSGPAEDWGYRRFILHYAHLCAAAGGVDAFCVGSELRGLTQIRGAGDAFPAVAELRRLVAEVRAILGPETKISYAADWSEYAGYVSPEGDRYFHLDPLWADPEVDFIGIDNYMPLSDWRDGADHADAGWGSIYNLDYLKANVAGGEMFDWYYDSPEGAAAQRRVPITDGAFGEPWIWRQKDLRGWWENVHRDRIGGAQAIVPSPWEPRSKPVWFTELGCPAIDKGTNQPNVFLDPKSSESFVPKWSNGRRDDVIQMQYLRAMAAYWDDPANNPEGPAGRMVDTARAFVWAWDARPFPAFPGNEAVWADGANYSRGHWISGRATNQPLAAVVAEICDRAGVAADVSGLYGVVRGYVRPDAGTARAALQPLMLAHGFEAVEREGELRFRMRGSGPVARLGREDLAVVSEVEGDLELSRAAEAEIAGRVRVTFAEAEGDFDTRVEEAVFPDEASFGAGQTDLPMLLTRAEGRAVAERFLAEARVARDGARFALPPSRLGLGAGDVVDLGQAGLYRIDRAEHAGATLIEAVRVEPAVYHPSDSAEERVVPRAFVAPVPVFPLFLDLPLLRGDEDPVAPHVAVTAVPWPGGVAVWDAPGDAGHALNRILTAPATVGVTESPLPRARPGLWDRGAPLRVRMIRGALASAGAVEVLNGANAVAIGDGSAGNWEVMQFARAELIAPGIWELSERLRGQAGTDGVMPDIWPAGSFVVVLDRAVEQVGLRPADRGLARYWRIGVAARGYDDPSVVRRVEAFDGVGLRPYPVAHLRALREPAADRFAWVRRTRIDGDSWAGEEVPLGEAAEIYRIRVRVGGAVVRETTVTVPEWTYPAGQRAADGATGSWTMEVAQLSERFGPGPFRGLAMTG
ncbi:MAG: glycoside hydrolase/phage tail family protein [Gemmobacter sp.]